MSTAQTEQKIVVFDIETQRTFEEVGGVDNRHQLGVSYVGVYAYTQQKLFGFFEKDLPALEKILIAEQPMLIGFNSIHFDVPVLQPYFKNLDLSTLPHLDIMKEIEKILGHRVKLDNVATATVYSSKSGYGLDAIRWYREGDFESLAKYCLDDVAITRDVYEYGLRHGYIYYTSGGSVLPIPVPWGKKPSVKEIVEEAFKKHQQLTVDYFEVDDAGNKEVLNRTFEILSLDTDGRFDAFCHRINNKKKFSIKNIWNVQDTGQIFAHQATLF